MSAPPVPYGRAAAARRAVAGSLASLVPAFLVLVLVAQRNPARLVVLLPLQGTSVVFVATVSTPLVLGLVSMLVVRRPGRATLVAANVTGCVLLVTGLRRRWSRTRRCLTASTTRGRAISGLWSYPARGV